MLAVIAVLLYAASRPRGWDAVSAKRQAQTEAILSNEASKIARHPATVTCDDKGEFVGFVQDADGLAEVGGDQAFLTPEICDTLYQLAVKHRVQSFAAHGARDRGARARVMAPAGRGERGSGELLRVPERRADRAEPRASAQSRARALMREQLATNASDSGTNVAVPRAEQLPRRRLVRPAPDGTGLSLAPAIPSRAAAPGSGRG